MPGTLQPSQNDQPKIGVIIPSYRVTRQIEGVLARIGPEVSRIYVVDDLCPDGTGDLVERQSRDLRLTVLRHTRNLGVGGAVMTGYARAIADGMDILVKLDGDGQMDASLIPQLVAPILYGEADYTKGNRFYAPEALEGMPAFRIFGNAGLSLLTKLSSGYWEISDPTNGFTAIHTAVAELLPFAKLDQRYFFESDMLFRLYTVRAVVVEIPIVSYYADEKSHLSEVKSIPQFLYKNLVNSYKRIVYSYFVRSFSFASIALVAGIILLGFGGIFGALSWHHSIVAHVKTPIGTVMLAVLPFILGFQLLMAFLSADIANAPRQCLHRLLAMRPMKLLRPFDGASRKKADS